MLEKIPESPLDCKEIQPVHPKGNESWIFIGRTDAEAPILWPPDAKNWLLGKDPGAGKDWKKEEKGTTENEMVGWHHWLDRYEFVYAPGVGDEQGSLACYSPRQVAKSQTQLSDWTELNLQESWKLLFQLWCRALIFQSEGLANDEPNSNFGKNIWWPKKSMIIFLML